MSYVTKEEIDRAGEMDLLTYLQNYEPHNLVHVSGDTYCTKEHDSLKISNGKWYWFSQGIGGVNALKYLMTVEEKTLPQAVGILLGKIAVDRPAAVKPREQKSRRILLPPKSKNADKAVAYLRSRGIHPEVIQYCLDEELIYESGDKYHNVVFLGFDEMGEVKYAALRSTNGPYKGDAAGSDKHCSFSFPGDSRSEHLHVFEAAVDLLSYASLIHMKGWDWHQDSMLSLAGVFPTKREGVLPLALDHYLKQHPEIKTVHLHLDRDKPGREASKGIMQNLEGRYTVLDEPPVCGKDMNDQLMAKLGLKRRKEMLER